MIVSSAMGEGANGGDAADPKRLIVCDVSRACFYAPAVRPVYVTIVDEDFEPGFERRCGKLNVFMYGARGVAINWHHHCKDHLEGLEFRQGKASPCILNHADRGFKLFVRGGDYAASGRETQLKLFSEQAKQQYECKVNTFGLKSRQERQVKFLNWILALVSDLDDDIVTYEADPRHAEIIISELGLNDAKPLATPNYQGRTRLRNVRRAQYWSLWMPRGTSHWWPERISWPQGGQTSSRHAKD